MPRGWARGVWSAHPFGGAVCRGHVQFPAFASNTLLLLPALQKVAVGFLVFLYCFVHNLAQLISSKLFLVPYTFCWRRKWQSTAVFLPGKSYGQKGLAGFSPWGCKSRTRLSDFTFTFQFDALEKEIATHSSILAWRIPWTEESGEPQSMGSQRVRHN